MSAVTTRWQSSSKVMFTKSLQARAAAGGWVLIYTDLEVFVADVARLVLCSDGDRLAGVGVNVGEIGIADYGAKRLPICFYVQSNNFAVVSRSNLKEHILKVCRRAFVDLLVDLLGRVNYDRCPVVGLVGHREGYFGSGLRYPVTVHVRGTQACSCPPEYPAGSIRTGRLPGQKPQRRLPGHASPFSVNTAPERSVSQSSLICTLKLKSAPVSQTGAK